MIKARVAFEKNICYIVSICRLFTGLVSASSVYRGFNYESVLRMQNGLVFWYIERMGKH